MVNEVSGSDSAESLAAGGLSAEGGCMTGYTVIDVETTGLSAEKHDRVVEIGVVFVSDRGEIQDQWSTLVDPQRDVGPTRVHGITASDVVGAPTFAQIAPYVLRAVQGRTVVAHNASFDLRFLANELLKAGVPLTDLPLRGLCTMRWSTAYLDAPSRRLIDCCAAGGVELVDAHSAAADARATAGLLAYFLRASRWQPPWEEELHESRAYSWAAYPGEVSSLRLQGRGEARASQRSDAWLDRIVSRMPRAADTRVDTYLAVLEMALLDGFLAEHEKDQLVSVARESGLTRGQVLDIHGSYLEAMAEVALEDGVVTDSERQDMERVAGAIGLQTADVEHVLETAGVASTSTLTAKVALTSSGITLAPGDRVVFTGDMQRKRSEWEELARSRGLVPGAVTKKTKLVVAADPNSLSGKAAKARSYGIPIITEAAFAQLMGT